MSGQTRRSWMVTISQAAVASRLSGKMPAEAQEGHPLPPGLYQPSRDHLSHALMSSEQFHPVAPGCPTDYIQPRTGPFKPLFFSPSEFAVIQRLTELLLGEISTSDRDEARSVNEEVAEWIDLRAWSAGGVREAALRMHPLHRELAVAYYGTPQVDQAETSDPAKTCREGVAWITGAAHSQHSADFLSLDVGQQLAILDGVSDERADKQLQNSGTRFFDFLKSQTIRAFYTSRTGLKELDFKGNAFYARSPGCDSK